MSKEQLVEGYVRGDVTRRTFVRRLTATGVSLAAALSYAELLRPATAHAGPGESENDVYDTYRETFLPPDVITQPPVDVTHSSAVAQALVDPNGNTATVWAEFRVGGSASWTVTDSVTAEGDVDRVVSIPLTGLASSTTYEVRAAARTWAGTTNGDVLTFATAAAPPPEPDPAPQPEPEATTTPAAAATAAVTATPSTPPAAPPDERAPYARLLQVTTSLSRVQRTGVLPLRVMPDEDGVLQVEAKIAQRKKGAPRKIRKVTIGTGKARGAANQPVTVKLKLRRAGRRALKSRKTVKVQLDIRVTDRLGNERRQITVVRLSG